MTHRATKLQAGQYQYRGYELFNATDYAGYRVWNITPPGCEGPTDSANTLKDAKALVDRYED